MRNALKGLGLACLISFSPIHYAHASGFPVVDLASIAESVKAYTQDLLNYEEYMQQTAEAVKTAKQTYDLYQQALVSYDHMLRQMEALKGALDRKDWDALYAKYESVMDRYPGSPAEYSPEWEEASAQVDNVYYRGNSIEELESEIDNLFSPAEAEKLKLELGRTKSRNDNATKQQMDVVQFNDTIDGYKDDLVKLDKARVNLGPEDHLATLQLIANQQQKSLEMQQQQLVQASTDLKYSNQLAGHIFAREQKAAEVNLSNLKDNVTSTYEVDETPLGGF